MTLHLMQVPDWLVAAVKSEAAFVDGAVVKDFASGQILAHLQPTQQLSKLVFEHSLGFASQPLTSISNLVGNVQLLDLKRMVERVQLVANIGAAASVLNLGMSVGGFAMVLLSIKRVESKIDGVAASVQSIALRQKANFMGRCSHALRRAEDAFALSVPAERHRYWQECDHDLGLLIEEGLHLIEGQGLILEGPSAAAMTEADRLSLLSDAGVVDTLRWLMAFSTARAEVLLCLGHAGSAGTLAARVADWLTPLPRSAKALAMAQMAGRTLPPSQIHVATNLAKATAGLVAAGHEVAAARAALCHELHAGGVDTAEHMLQLREDPVPQVLAWVAPR